MRSKNAFLTLRVAFFLLFVFVRSSFAQQGSVYFSVGDNLSWYKSSTINIQQPEQGNSYDLWKVKGNDKTHTPIGVLNLNYRLGFYCNDVQDLGVEFNFDPVNYQVTDGQRVTVFGSYNNILSTHNYMQFSKRNGSFYYYDGLNLCLFNLVKRWGVYRANSSKVSVDILGKIGVGPALPHFSSSLPVNPENDGQLNWGGWDYGVETGVRVSLYRYGYVELAGKYDYAMLSNLQIYEGTASQNLSTFEVIASIGFTFPTTRLNPLFYKPKTIVTILPWYQVKDILGEQAPPKSKSDSIGIDSLGGPLIPEFKDIISKGVKYNLDSLAALDSIAKIDTTKPDTTAVVPKKKRHWWQRKPKRDTVVTADTSAQRMDSLLNAPAPKEIAPPAPPPPPPPPPPKDTAPARDQAPIIVDPKETESKKEEKEIIKRAIEGVNFETSKDIIQKSSYKILDDVVSLMKDNPNYKLRINGHTDNKGSAAFNKKLSENRAIAVKKYLVSHGVEASRLKTAGYGGERPIADNETEAGRLKNRRVEFIIE